MKGKAKNKRKIGKVILIGLGFFLTIVLTFTTTLAWFYDSDWASKSITMAGTVGIEIRDGETNDDGTPKKTTGSGQLHFNITTDKAYPGQAIDVAASCYNNGGKSNENKPDNSGGSPCYIRAYFAVYTNIGMAPDPADYANGTNDEQYKKDYEIYQNEKDLSAAELYRFLQGLIDTQNTTPGVDYYWAYYHNPNAMPLSSSGISTGDIKYYIDGTASTTDPGTSAGGDKGYFYLCTNSTEKILKPLAVGSSAVFLWNSTFIIPWKLTNASADKHIFVALQFQAIQTFIPKIKTDSPGVIVSDPDNQLPDTQCTYDSIPVQTVFSSSNFATIDTKININGNLIDFTNGDYEIVSAPPAPSQP